MRPATCDAKAFASAKARADIEVLRNTLCEFDHHDFLTRRNVRVFEADADARKYAQRCQTLFCLARQTALVEPANVERNATANQALTGALGAAHHDPRDAHLLPLADDEAHPSPRVVRRNVQGRFHFSEGETPLGVLIEQAASSLLDFDLRNRRTELNGSDALQLFLDDHSIALESQVVERSARAELDWQVQHQ